ncbi:MAG: elongation factor P [Deltaproteobacteria bacterium]|nr:elongation factor P [Deltaproteobacteria bacterium]
MQGNDLRKGQCIKVEGKLWQCMEANHRTPGNLRAFIQAKLRNLHDGSQKEFRFSATEKLDPVDLFERKMQYLYEDDTFLHFMDTESYEQHELNKSLAGDQINYLTENLEVSILFAEGKALTMRIPETMEFEIVEADPEIKGATATNSFKNAKTSNGVDIQVPQFIHVGDWVKINTESGKYMERVKK